MKKNLQMLAIFAARLWVIAAGVGTLTTLLFGVRTHATKIIVGFEIIGVAFLAAILVTSVYHVLVKRMELGCMAGMMIGMTLGMISGFVVGYVVGASLGMFAGSVAGIFVGMLVGVAAGRCCGIMGVMEGMMAGLMAGTMGPMLAVMML